MGNEILKYKFLTHYLILDTQMKKKVHELQGTNSTMLSLNMSLHLDLPCLIHPPSNIQKL